MEKININSGPSGIRRKVFLLPAKSIQHFSSLFIAVHSMLVHFEYPYVNVLGFLAVRLGGNCVDVPSPPQKNINNVIPVFSAVDNLKTWELKTMFVCTADKRKYLTNPHYKPYCAQTLC